ncbi:MAG: hypothetical protein DRP56_08205 [Planctomycetota bacterium]|nr:MAG: hypothetical protein DRP56_08205 [Planctomycetota bacterium]
MNQWGHLPKNKQKAIYWIRQFQRDLHTPRSLYSLVDSMRDMERYKVVICVLLSYLELNITKDATDLNEAKVMIDCIKRTLPNPVLENYQRRVKYLDNVYNELKLHEDKKRTNSTQ